MPDSQKTQDSSMTPNDGRPDPNPMGDRPLATSPVDPPPPDPPPPPTGPADLKSKDWPGTRSSTPTSGR